MQTQRRLRPAEAIYQPEWQPEPLPPVTAWLSEEERPLRDVEDVLKYHLKCQLWRGTYESRVRDLVLVALGEESATVRAANEEAREFLELRLRSMLERTLERVVGRAVRVIVQ